MTLTNPLSSLPAKPNPSRGAKAARWKVGSFCLLLAGFIACAEANGLCPGEREKAMKLRQRIVNEWPLRASSDEVSQYVQNLAIYLSERYNNSNSPSIPWRFTVVRNLAPNAFSIGAGNVFVNEGAITFAQSEAELAAILAHEMAHELARHFCEASRSSVSNSLFDIFSTPDTQQYNANIGSMTQTIDPAKEREADHVALSILWSAGFNPRAMLDVARRLPSGLSGHLPDASRIQSLEQSMANAPPLMQGSSAGFRKIKQILSAE